MRLDSPPVRSPCPTTLLQQFRAYFLANPTHEVPNLSPTISATAAACETAAQAISTAATASNQANSDARTAKGKLENAITAGRTRLSGLRTELDQTLSDEDPSDMPSASSARATPPPPKCPRISSLPFAQPTVAWSSPIGTTPVAPINTARRF